MWDERTVDVVHEDPSVQRTVRPVKGGPKGRPVQEGSKRQAALRLAEELESDGMGRRDILARIVDDLAIPVPTATSYVSAYFSKNKRAA